MKPFVTREQQRFVKISRGQGNFRLPGEIPLPPARARRALEAKLAAAAGRVLQHFPAVLFHGGHHDLQQPSERQRARQHAQDFRFPEKSKCFFESDWPITWYVSSKNTSENSELLEKRLKILLE